MLAPQADRVMVLREWEDRWQEDRIGFHLPHVHKMLENNIDKVLAGRTGVRFFFPLCGKAVDMKWLADMGHSVVGVEIAEKAIQQFFEENNMTYSVEPVAAIPGAKVYKSSEKKISLYQCDLYNFSSSIEGQFGAIWDRGSLVAINPRDREKYAALIISLMASDCRYLLDTLLYNPNLYNGPPFFVPDEQVIGLFGESCDIELLQSVDSLTDRQRGWAGIQKLLDENNQLIQCIMDFQSKGKTAECSQYQQMLHRNLVYLATIADSNQNMQSLLPAPPTQNMPMGPGGMNQSGPPPQPPHGHNMPSEGMVSGGPPAPHMQNQMNGQMPGPNHMPMQGPGPGPNQPPNMPSGSMNMPPSSHGSMGGYNHAVPSSQGIPAQSQMNMTQGQPMGNYGPRPNMNMQPNQGPMMHQQPPSQQYNMPPGGGGQHYQGQQNPMGMMGQVNQGNHVMGQRPMPPYRPPQQGNAQYGQQQEAYQQGPPQQQGYPPQQQYPGQQGYPPQQQGYGPSQSAPGQYPNYPQGQGQQYGAYRPPQPGPPQAQQQRPYGYDQSQYGNYQQ